MILEDKFAEAVNWAKIVREVCRKKGGTDGRCKEAAITLAELLIYHKVVDIACVCWGTYQSATGPRPHYWVRICDTPTPILDPTVDQFSATEKVAFAEKLPYTEADYLCFNGGLLGDMHKAVVHLSKKG